MARILISYFWEMDTEKNGLHVFWGGLVKALEENGNDVMTINTSFINTYGSNRANNETINELILAKTKDFDPEIIFTFNHRIPQCILNNFKDVPIIIWDGDELKYFCDLGYIKKNIDRYKLFSITTAWDQDYLDFGFKKDQIFCVPAATSIKAKNFSQNMNISFVGSIHYSRPELLRIISSAKYNNELNRIMQEYFKTPSLKDCERLFLKYLKDDYKDLDLDMVHLYPLFNFRILTLLNLIDLGLHIRGPQWTQFTDIFPYLLVTWDKERIYTLEDNEIFYNSSKISLAPIHPQGRGVGFPWRVFDIMASNACLVSGESSDLRILVKDYVDIPMYKTPWEAREICKDLLKDDKARKEIVLASQKYINENARWEHRFKKIEEILNIKLIGLDKKGSFKNLIYDEAIEFEIAKAPASRILKPKDKLRYKIWSHYNKILKRKGII